MANEISARYEGQLRCKVTRTKTGQAVHTDVTADHGGLDQYFSPIELVVASLNACVTSMMAVVAERSKLDLGGLQVSTSFEMVSAPVRRIGSVHLVITVPNGAAIPDVVRQKLQAAAGACPVKNSLHPDVQVSLEFIYQ